MTAAAAPQWIVRLLWIAPLVTVLAMLAQHILSERREIARLQQQHDATDDERPSVEAPAVPAAAPVEHADRHAARDGRR